MGKLEIEVKARIRKTKIKTAIIQSIAAVGLLSVALVAPNSLRMLEVLGWKPYKKNYEDNIKRALNKLIQDGFVEKIQTKNGTHIKLTLKGDQALPAFLNSYQVTYKKKWDGKYRIVIFDIKEFKKDIRNKLRNTLKGINFLKLQNSVWVYPYDCEDLIILLKSDLHVGKEVLYVIADKIENDGWIRSHFNLSTN